MMFQNYDYTQPLRKKRLTDKYDGMGIGIENQHNVIKDKADARYEQQKRLGDPATAPLRIVVLHKSECGASSFMLKVIYNEFSEETYDNRLLQWDQHQFQYKYQYQVDDDKEETLTSETLRISVFDAAGFDDSQSKENMNERIGDILNEQNVVLLMYSVADRNSFEGDFSIQDIKTYLDHQLNRLGQKKIVILVATKSDLDRKVSTANGQQLADQWKVPFVEISNCTGSNIKKLIDEMCYIHKKHPEGVNYPPPANNGGCCLIL